MVRKLAFILIFLPFLFVFPSNVNSIGSGQVSLSNLRIDSYTLIWDGLYGELNAGNSNVINYQVNGSNVTNINFEYEGVDCYKPKLINAYLIASNSSTINPPLFPGNITKLDNLISTSENDNATRTFGQINETYETIYGTIYNVPTVKLRENFSEGFMEDSSGNIVFISKLCNNCLNWGNSHSDYEMILPRNSSFKLNYTIWAEGIYTCAPHKTSGSGSYYSAIGIGGSGGHICNIIYKKTEIIFPNCSKLLESPYNSRDKYNQCVNTEWKPIESKIIIYSCNDGYKNTSIEVKGEYIDGILYIGSEENEFNGYLYKEYNYSLKEKGIPNVEFLVIPNKTLEIESDCKIWISSIEASMDKGLNIGIESYSPSSKKKCVVPIRVKAKILTENKIIRKIKFEKLVDFDGKNIYLIHEPVWTNCEIPGELVDLEIYINNRLYNRYSLAISHKKSFYGDIFEINNRGVLKLCEVSYVNPSSFTRIKINNENEEIVNDILYTPFHRIKRENGDVYYSTREYDILETLHKSKNGNRYRVILENRKQKAEVVYITDKKENITNITSYESITSILLIIILTINVKNRKLIALI